jgi:prepilin-type N-terminal cleavage/methylation domain-containing protein
MFRLAVFNLKSHSNASGFTLIEVLISITILSFISLYTFKMVDNSTDTRDRVVKEDQILLQTLTAVSRIDIDFSQIYNPLFAYSKANPAVDPSNVYDDNTSAPRATFDGKTKNGMLIPNFISEDKSTISFLTLANRRKLADTKESRFAW